MKKISVTEVIKKVLGPSPLTFTLEKIKNEKELQSDQNQFHSKKPYYVMAEVISETETPNNIFDQDEWLFQHQNPYAAPPPPVSNPKPVPAPRPAARRMTNAELRAHYRSLNKDEKLIMSVLESVEKQQKAPITEEQLANLGNYLKKRSKYRVYRVVKNSLPTALTSYFATVELKRMALANLLGATTVPFTLVSYIGISAPAYYFFYMLSYYTPNPYAKAFCRRAFWIGGLPIIMIGTITDHLAAPLEKKLDPKGTLDFEIDLTKTGGSIPTDVGNLDVLEKILGPLPKDYMDNQ